MSYVIRRKVTHIKPTPIPETTYKPELYERKSSPEPIKATEQMERLARPKAAPPPEEPLPDIPSYQNPVPSFSPMDFRVNEAVLRRDLFLLRKRENQEAQDKENEPTEFLKWQQKMKDLDEEEREEEIKKRHEDVIGVRKRAIKAKKSIEEQRMQKGKALRDGFAKEKELIDKQNQDEMEKFKAEKEQRIDGVPRAIAKAQRDKLQATKAMKKQIRAELREAHRLQQEEVQQRKEMAETLRHQVETHSLTNGNVYTSRTDITDTKFLAALTDEEANELVMKQKEMDKAHIENLIARNRQQKEERADQMMSMLDEITRFRDAKDEIHSKERKDKAESEAKKKRLNDLKEEEENVALQKRLEKKRKQRLKEVEEMEERSRQIDAMNRYLALNKQAHAIKTFESQQDAKVRAANDRQTQRIPIDQTAIPTAKKRRSNEMSGLKTLLGL